MRTRTLLLPAALAFGVCLAAPPSGAADGLLFQRELHLVSGTLETGARGGVTTWFRVNPDRSTVQGFRVWVQGLSDSTDASIWITKPGSDTAEEAATMAAADNGSAVWEVVVNSHDLNPLDLPLKVESVLKLREGKIEIQVAGEPVLRGKIGDFDWGSLDAALAGPGRTAAMRRAPPPGVVPDDAARGVVRLWRRRVRGDPQNPLWALTVFAKGLTADETYEVWIEDDTGSLVEVGSMDSTGDGLGLFSLDKRYGGDFPPGIGVSRVQDFSRRRIELRRSGFTDYSLAGLIPRMR